LALLLLLLLCPALGDEAFRCVICHEVVDSGYSVKGKFYCPLHLDHALAKCHTCGTAIQGDYVVLTQAKIPVCLPCRQTFKKCFLCSLPCDLNSGARVLPDGRPICRDHATSGVTESSQAKRILQQASNHVQRVLGPRFALEHDLKEVKLVDLVGLAKAVQGGSHTAGLKTGRVLGITTIVFVRKGTEQWLEPATIHLLDHVPTERMLSVAAHEYAHVWHAKNHRNYPATTPILREGFAEWVCYKMNEALGRTEQTETLKNPSGGIYYQGLMKLLEMEEKYGTQRVVEFATKSTTI